ncbi:helix-turn-helix domain-containing protein [Actinomadura sp. HBU206391]|uniref:helix-turn-helix domain-containing protein n=1 Tax=Actinomadura sp. HBU206391 TaxID=2731692 RepID=UPI00164EE159|nr:XRE family transcriptional regulator [Actinomadura sp. HBU206391]MBC6457749.1 ImmA/IrrE family metallo-endopeptidase [Actinomadura sp. HBU206391]
MVNPSRIVLARRRNGLTHVELSALVGVSAQSLSNYEKSRQEPSTDVIKRLAHALGFPVGFFHGADTDPIPAESVSFRARSKMRAHQRNMALGTAELVVEFHDWITAQLRLPSPDLPTLDRPDPATAAAMVRARWSLGQAPISNMIHLLEARGVRVFSLGPSFQDVDAFSFYRGSTPFVFLSTGKTPERSRFDAAHELGHLVLHCEERPVDRPQAEDEANTFARHFLMPPDSVSAHMPQSPFVDQIIRGKRIWKVSALALTYQLHDLEMLTDWNYRQACIELGKRGYKSAEPGGLTTRETSQLLEKVFRVLRAKGLTLPQIADQLDIPEAILTESVFGLTPVVIQGQRREAHLVRAPLTLVKS